MTRTQDDAKRRVGEEVAGWIDNGMTVGLGSGSTAARAIEALGRRVAAEGLHIVGVATSIASERLAESLGIRVVRLDDVDAIDLAFDGADEVDGDFNLIKGAGGAHTREKIVAAQARRFVILIDESKRVTRLGSRMPLPVEIVPMAVRPVTRRIESLGGRPDLRMDDAQNGPYLTDQGFWILDAAFDGIDNPITLDRELLMTPGILDHGLFLGMATDVLVGTSDGRVQTLSR